jgi:hypothetical protein
LTKIAVRININASIGYKGNRNISLKGERDNGQLKRNRNEENTNESEDVPI